MWRIVDAGVSERHCPYPVPLLRFRPLWLTLGWLLVAEVAWASLTPSPPDGLTPWQWDKANHFAAYAAIMFWFAQIYARPAARRRWVIGLLLMGLAIELLQGLGGDRQFDPLDMLANGLGALVGWAAAATPLGRGLHWLEARILSKR